MIHLIYIYIIINAFLTGYVLEDDLKTYEPWNTVVVILAGLGFMTPFLIVAFSYEYSKLWFNESWIGNIRYVYRYKKGKETVTPEAIEILNKSMDKKLAKPKKTFSDKIYIWGVKEINKTYLINQKSK